ncbi:hypothetical protein L1987_22979 [Smallanthus sonchifolius]|uniref:Uncharacterized protein n=1 Tax=Smallanthus sonchifolius TaxID=185202 RepID=A0ACB9IGD8_9ASTR|nr:hypothetical protein L1987_22979 [Smallanthus sonchifolius]
MNTRTLQCLQFQKIFDTDSRHPLSFEFPGFEEKLAIAELRAANVSFVCCLWQNPKGKVDYWNYCFVDCIRFR